MSTSKTMHNAIRCFGTALLSLALFGCGPSPEKIGGMVKASMQQKLTSDPQFKDLGLEVEHVQVLKEGENRYQGIARIRHEGDIHEVPVHVTADGDNVIWRTDQGAFLFVVQKAFRKAMQQPTQPPQ